MAAAVLAADCSTSGGGLVAASTDAGESGAPTDAGSGGGNGQGDGRGSDAGGSRAAYHVIDLGTKALDRGGVMDMSRNGLVLAASGGVRWVYDTSTGATRDVPPTVSVINSSGVTAGVRPAGKKDASGLCDDSEVFLHYPDGTEKGLGNPVNGDYGGLRCEAAQGCIVGDECRLLSALDDAGDLVAQWDSLENGVHSTNVYVWDGTSWRKLPRLGGESDSADSAAHGEVVGRSSTKRAADLSQTHAVMWRGDVATDLGTLGGGRSAAHRINERGQVVGQSNYAGRVSSHAFLWDSGRMTDLGSLPGFDTTVAASINLHGQVVGTASYYSWAGPSATRAIIFAGGQAYDLNDLVDTHDLLLVTGRRIADNGAIAVSTGGPSYHPVVLVPTGAPLAPDRSWRSAGTVMASGELAANLALDATNVYWITVSADRDLSIKAAPKVGGAVTTLWSTHAGFTYGNLLVDDRYVWFDMMVCAGAVCTGTTPGIWRVPKTGGSPERFAEGSEWLALNDRKVYSTRPVPSSYPTQELISTPNAGGATVVHATGEFASYLAVDGDVAYFVKRVQTGNWSLSVLCSESSGRVTELTAPSIDFSGGEIQLDATSIYLRDGYHLLRFPRSGGAPRVLATITPSSPPSGHDLEVNGGFVYWTQDAHDGQPACVTRIDANGGNAVCLDRGFWRYPAVRVDDTSVFLIRDTDIVRLAK